MRFLRQPALVAPVLGLLIGIGWLALGWAGGLDELELRVYDWYRRTQARLEHPDPRLVILRVTAGDLERYGSPLPEPRLAQALARLLEARARAVGVDLSPGGGVARVMRGHPDVVVADAADLVVDPDGSVRRALLWIPTPDGPRPSFALQLAARWLAAEGAEPLRPTDLDQGFELGDTRLARPPADAVGYTGLRRSGFDDWLDFRAAPDGFRSYALGDLLDGEVGVGAIHDRIVIVGETAGTGFRTPFSTGEKPQLMSGLELHAHATGQLLRYAVGESSPISLFGSSAQLGWAIGWSLLGGLIGLWRHPLRGGLFALACGAALVGLGWLGFWFGYWIPLVPAALGLVCSAGIGWVYTSRFRRHERTRIERLLGPLGGGRLPEHVFRHSNVFLGFRRPRVQQLTLTALVVELDAPPAETLRRFDARARSLAACVEERGGVVEEFGAAMLRASFGVPFPRGSAAEVALDARQAVECALALESALGEPEDSAGPFLRIGISTGPAVVGPLGRGARQRYAAAGEPIDVAVQIAASEAPELAPESGSRSRVLISEETSRHVASAFALGPPHSLSLRGRPQKLAVYRVRRAR